MSYFPSHEQIIDNFSLTLTFYLLSFVLPDISPPVFSADGASITMSLGVPDNLVSQVTTLLYSVLRSLLL